MAQQTVLVITKDVGTIINVTEKFSKLEFTCNEVRQDGKNNILKFQAINKMADNMSNIGAGVTMNVTFEVEGREYNKDGKVIVFMNLNVVSFNVLSMPKTVDEPKVTKPDDVYRALIIEDDDLPF